MPEGDTIARAARVIGDAVQGQAVTAVDHDPERAAAGGLEGGRLVASRARGKHLLLDFDNGLSVHSHLGMTGSWHLYARDEPWRKPRRRRALELWFGDTVLVCFSPKLLRVLPTRRLARDPLLATLGADVLDAGFDRRAAVAALRARPGLPIGEALMNQRLVAGIGNVWKSEILFLAGVHPRAPVGVLDDAALELILGHARHWMRRNLDGRARRARLRTLGDRLWTYRRAGLPCLRCETPIEMLRQGDDARSTYYCPNCQPPAR